MKVIFFRMPSGDVVQSKPMPRWECDHKIQTFCEGGSFGFEAEQLNEYIWFGSAVVKNSTMVVKEVVEE